MRSKWSFSGAEIRNLFGDYKSIKEYSWRTCTRPTLTNDDFIEIMTIHENKNDEHERKVLTAELIREDLKFATNMEQLLLTHDLDM